MESMIRLLLVEGVHPETEPVEVDAGLRGEDAHGQLLAGHLQAEYPASLVAPSGVDGYVQGQGSLPQRGPGTEDDHI